MGMEKTFKDLYQQCIRVLIVNGYLNIGGYRIAKSETVREMGEFLIECADKMEDKEPLTGSEPPEKVPTK